MLTLVATVRRTKKRAAAFGLGLMLATASLLASFPAEAHHRARHHHAGHWARAARHTPHFARHGRAVHSVAYEPGRNFAAIVVDGNSGQTLYARDEDEPRHPASITKVMTLYLLFEQIESGRLSLNSELRISAHAAAQKPTKLGLRAGATITVEDAIKAIVTRSANDMAVAVAEAVGGDEQHFAELMTRKAQALGMNRTVFVNASGLPDDAQITTARDLSILGRAVQERFPRYYRYFSTHAFYYDGATILNHNHLMDRVEGMDGIKTGYTRASGFNLLTSVKRDGHYIVAAVMGGVSAASRDRIMAGLIEGQIERGATIRTASAITDNSARDQASRQRNDANADLPVRAATQRDSQERPRPALAYVEPRTESQPDQASKLALSAIAQKTSAQVDPVRVASIGADVPIEKSRSAYGALLKAAALDPTPARTMRWVAGAAPANAARPSEQTIGKLAALATESAPVETAKAAASRRPAAARAGWMIQIGATDDIARANALLAKAKAEGRTILSGAQAFTEKVQKGGATLYRARFAGLEADSAELACKSLKRTGFSCFATKN